MNKKKTNFSYLLQAISEFYLQKHPHASATDSLYTKIYQVEIILVLYDKVPLLTRKDSEHIARIRNQKTLY